MAGSSLAKFPSISYVKGRLRYDPETGELYWKRAEKGAYKTEAARKKFNTVWAGKIAGTKPPGNYYKAVGLCGTHCSSHHLAWGIYYGEYSSKPLDHINGDLHDNRIANLRQASQTVNMRNMPKYRSNKSGLTGVSWHKASKMWTAQITLNGKRTYLGVFRSKMDAYEAWLKAKKENGFTESHGIRSLSYE